jgi:hypothetical protein
MNTPLPIVTIMKRTCGICGTRQRTLLFDTKFGTLTGFCCFGHKDAPPVYRHEPFYDRWELTVGDQDWLSVMGISAD